MRCRNKYSKIELVPAGYFAALLIICLLAAAITIVAGYWLGTAGCIFAAALSAYGMVLMCRDERQSVDRIYKNF